jgi:hypothetical protein
MNKTMSEFELVARAFIIDSIVKVQDRFEVFFCSKV